MNKIIYAISFLHRGERIVVKANNTGKFRVPVISSAGGRMKTEWKNLSARQVIEHEIIKNCDPTLYLQKGEKMRVYMGGDSSYLPAQSEGLVSKHDKLFQESQPKVRKSKLKLDKLKNKSYNKTGTYKQAALDMYGWWPDDGYAD